MNELDHKFAKDAHLFIVDDEGVVFLEHAQKLYALNTAATYLWCSLQEGQSLSQTIEEMAESCGISRGRVENLVRETVSHWGEMGLLEETGISPRVGLSRGPESDDSPGFLHAIEPLRATTKECRYRILDSYIRVTFNSSDAAKRVESSFGHLSTNESSCVDVTFQVVEAKQGFFIKQGDSVESFCPSIQQLVPALKGALSAYALNGADHLMILHAAVVGDGRSCIVLPGESGSGKSTLSAAMMQAGYEFLSDEFAMLQKDTLNVRSVPLALCLKSTSWNLLTDLFPDLEELPSHERFDDKVVRYMQPCGPSGDGDLDRERPVKAIVFPRYQPGVKTAMRPISPIEALGRLSDQALVIPKWFDRATVASLVNWIQHLDCWELQMSSLGEAIEFVGECFEDQIERRSHDRHDHQVQAEAQEPGQ